MCANISKKRIRRKLRNILKNAVEKGINIEILKQYKHICLISKVKKGSNRNRSLIIAAVILLLCSVFTSGWFYSILTARCLVPSNYLVWEATRPLANCAYCENVTEPIILRNITRQDFAKYMYSSKPIVVKNAINKWRATKEFSFELFKGLYQNITGSYESVEDGCQFLNFKTNLFSLKEVFDMPEARAKNEVGQEPWYIGWGNCHPEILANLRQYYSIPEFLPEDAEYPATENIFLGYENGAVMHLDYIPRLMWQGQIKGSKTWSLAPVPECEHVCEKFKYHVESGDIVLLDTRIWYHATSIPKGELSITVQSEYG